MIKVMFFLYRRSDLSMEQFIRYSESTHIPLVAQVPGLVHYVVNHTVDNPAGVSGVCDAVAELWFASPNTFQAALATPDAAAALGDQPNYLDMARTHMLIVDENVVIS